MYINLACRHEEAMRWRWRKCLVVCCPALLLMLTVLAWIVCFREGTGTWHNLSFRPLSKSGTRQVLLLAYYRTGSSFLGEQFNKNPKMFYFFEPLWNYENAVKKREGLMYANGSNRIPPKHGLEHDEQTAILNDLLNCRMRSLPLPILTGSRIEKSQDGLRMSESHSFVTWPGRHRTLENSSYYECINKNTGLGHTNCVPVIENVCKKAETIVVKTIRTRMWQVETLLRENPSLKVVHLMRDPRGQILSAKVTLTKDDKFEPDFYSSQFCLMMLRDIYSQKELQKKFPGRILSVLYEDFAEYPLKTVTSIYDFLGLDLPQNIRRSLANGAKNGGVDTGFMGTGRKNPNATAHAWMLKIDPALAGIVDETCSTLYSELGLLKYEQLKKTYNF